jgi:hypothetical protein
MLLLPRCCPQEQEVRMAEARQRLEAQQAEAAAAAASSLSRRTSQMPPPAAEASDGALSMSAPVTLNDRQHRTAAALLASLSQTAARGKERLARLERVLNTIAADASEPDKVGKAHQANHHWRSQLIVLVVVQQLSPCELAAMPLATALGNGRCQGTS